MHNPKGCWCLTCVDEWVKEELFVPSVEEIFDPRVVRFNVCATCGNKRCPHATDHRHACTNSNEPGQRGSIYE
jgi:hypothetical protein